MVGSGFVYVILKIPSKLPSDKMEDWRDDSVFIKLPHPTPPPRGPEFNSRHTHGSQFSVSPGSEDLTPFSSP